MRVQHSDRILRFGDFELDVQAGELRRFGIRLPVQGRPLQVLAVLLRTPGRVVSTEQLRTELWPADTFVDFDQGIRNAVARLRAVLIDTADKPHYIETVPRRGYRFIGTLAEHYVQPLPDARTVTNAQPVTAGAVQSPPVPDGLWRIALIAAACLVTGAGAATWIEHARAKPANDHIRSLAVLPLENLSGDSRQEYFANGVTDELITAIAKINSIQVISRTSVMQYKGVHNKALPQIARELGVDAVVEGTLARSGDRVRITAQLIEASTDRHIWADRYERSSRDILLLENEIAKVIAEQLRGKLDSHQQRRFDANSIDPDSHEAYLQGLYLWNRRTPAALREAVRYFTKALERSPTYALAYAARAHAYLLLGCMGIEAIPPSEAFPKVKADAEKAVQLDANSAEVHTVLAATRLAYEWDWRGAETEFQRAIELSPNHAPAHQWYGQCLCDLGRFEECLAETSRAHALDPAYLIAAVDVGHRLYDARRYADAIEPIRKVLEFNPDFAYAHRYLGQVYEANRMYPEALREMRKTLELSSYSPTDIAALGHTYAASGHRNEARKELETLDELAKRRYVSSYGRVLIYAGLGEKDRAFDWLERGFQERSTWMIRLRVDPRLDPLRGDARFTDLMRRVGLTP